MNLERRVIWKFLTVKYLIRKNIKKRGLNG